MRNEITDEIFQNLLNSSAVATFIINPEHLVIYWNKSCEILTGLKSSEIIGTDNHWQPFYKHKRPCLADIVISGNYNLISKLYDRHSRSVLIPNGLHAEGWYQQLGGRRRHIIFDAAPIYNHAGELIAAIETLQDTTAKKSAEEKKESLIVKLQELLSENTSIKGYIPICASCKNIRQEDNKWIVIEQFIMERTEAKFSHSICPDCAKKLYPELDLFKSPD
ncbi:MAG: PAS domain-containing protein [Proteobacteria bacterium]|nr:PAS domain-containing protein [Pseudomonadota bacterium]MBU1715420.1 PAS domain-containing protein [Pseudomonadota bacterium]